MDLRLLGPLEVHLEDGRVELGPRKQRAVLAMPGAELQCARADPGARPSPRPAGYSCRNARRNLQADGRPTTVAASYGCCRASANGVHDAVSGRTTRRRRGHITGTACAARRVGTSTSRHGHAARAPVRTGRLRAQTSADIDAALRPAGGAAALATPVVRPGAAYRRRSTLRVVAISSLCYAPSGRANAPPDVTFVQVRRWRDCQRRPLSPRRRRADCSRSSQGSPRVARQGGG